MFTPSDNKELLSVALYQDGVVSPETAKAFEEMMEAGVSCLSERGVQMVAHRTAAVSTGLGTQGAATSSTKRKTSVGNAPEELPEAPPEHLWVYTSSGP